MTCQIISSEGAVFALWGKPAKEDMKLVLDRMRAAAAAAGRPIVYITRVPVDAPPPEPDVRQYLNELMPEMRRVCASYHVVLEGVGFVSALKRAILAGLMQLGWPRRTFFVHASAKEALFAVSDDHRGDVEAMLKLAEREGFLPRPAPLDAKVSHLGGGPKARDGATRSPHP